MLKKFIKATTVEVSKGVDKKVISVFVIATLFGFFAQVVFATPPSSPYTPGETLNPSCSPGDTNCDVSGAFVGDSGSGGTKGLVPAPAAGDAAASKFLSADGTWTVPSGSGNVSKVGTPADNQVGVWTGDGTIEGTSGLTYDGSNLQLTGDIGSTGTRITKGWFTDLVVTNDISGSITGNAASVTNGLYTTDISSTVQAYDADLDTWATLTPSANAQSLVTAADYAAMRALLDLEAGTDFYSISAADAAFQPLDSDLTTIAGLTATSNNFMVAASSAWSSMTPTAATALLDAVVGDSGAGGTKGLVPAPGAGDAAASKFLKADGTWATAGGSSALSGLTAASATNTLANVNYAQVWNWDSLANETAFQLGSTSITSGKLLDLSINGTAAESSQTGLNISLAGANASSTVTSYGAYITNTHYGTSATNVALYASASSGTTNYAAQFYGSVYMDDGAFAYDSSTGITTVDNLNLGTLNFDTDAGIVTWVDLPVTSAASSGTVESYTAAIDGTSILTVYAESDGTGSIQNQGVGIGTATPAYMLDVLGTGTGGVIARFNDSNTTGCTLATDGTISCSSDINLKKNIVTLDGKDFVLSENDETDWSSEGVLARLMSITPVTYNWKSELNTDSKHIGLIAQDVERVFPDIVTTDKTTGYKSLGYTNFIPYTIKAVQELDLNLEGIAGTITPLEGSDNASFVATFFDNLFAKIREWLASATNGIMHFFAKEVNTNTLCVSDDSGAKTCITKDQLDSLLSNAGVSAGVTGGNTDTNTPSNNTDTTSDNTADTSSNDSTGTVSSENNTADTPEDTTTDTTTDNSDTTPPSSETTEGQGTDTATSEGDTSDTSSSDTTDSTNSSQTTTETTSTDDSSDATGDTSTSSDNSSSTSSDTSSSDSSSQDSGSGGDTASGN